MNNHRILVLKRTFWTEIQDCFKYNWKWNLKELALLFCSDVKERWLSYSRSIIACDAIGAGADPVSHPRIK